MKRLYYDYPKTIGEELKAQIKYCKSIGKIKNNSDLSLKMREIEEYIFGVEKQYLAYDERTLNLPRDKK